MLWNRKGVFEGKTKVSLSHWWIFRCLAAWRARSSRLKCRGETLTLTQFLVVLLYGFFNEFQSLNLHTNPVFSTCLKWGFVWFFAFLQLCGTMVWILIAGTEYFHVPALCWVMFIAVLFWVLTIFLFIIYLIGAHKRMPHVPWNTVVKTHTFCTYIYLLWDSSGPEPEPKPRFYPA